MLCPKLGSVFNLLCGVGESLNRLEAAVFQVGSIIIGRE